MEMSIWNENFLLDGDWGLDMPFHQENGLYGDLKLAGHVNGIDVLSFQPQDAGNPTVFEASSESDGLDTEWMETSDLGKYFSDLGTVDESLALDSSLHQFTSLINAKETTEDQEKEQPCIVVAQPGISNEVTFDALVSPPHSPEEQVTPVIQFDTPVVKTEPASVTDVLPSLTAEGSSSLITQDLFDKLDFTGMSNVVEDSFIYIDGGSDILTSPLSADEVESMLSISEPSSPTSTPDTSLSSIIETSPELFKVISTSSKEVAARFSPYQKSKPSKDIKPPPRRRAPAQPVPEHIINEQVNRKDKKKLQNKNAAIRYRQKKRDEAMDIKGEEQGLVDYNLKLKSQVEDLEREVRYMKNLMEDVCRAKGLL